METVNALLKLPDFSEKVEHVCEIGAATGRYATQGIIST